MSTYVHDVAAQAVDNDRVRVEVYGMRHDLASTPPTPSSTPYRRPYGTRHG